MLDSSARPVLGSTFQAQLSQALPNAAAWSVVACYSALFLYHRLYDMSVLAIPLVHAASRKIPCSVVLNNGSIEQGATAISEAIRLSIAEAEMRVRLEQGGLL
jgi:hypothetical protein